MNNKVVVTGVGLISPIGNNIVDFTKSLKKGINGINKITYFDTTDFTIKIAGETSIILDDFFSKKDLNKLDKFTCYALLASEQAVEQSGINKLISSDNVGVIVGSGIGGIETFETQHKRLLQHPRKVSPFFIPSMISDIASGHISIKYGFKGVNYCVVSACATGSHAIGDAYRQIGNAIPPVIMWHIMKNILEQVLHLDGGRAT